MDWKKWIKSLLTPPVWVTVALALVSVPAFILIFVEGWEETWPAYAVYVVAFYTLTVICVAGWKIIPGWSKNTKAKLYENKYASRYLTDVAYRTHVNLYRSLALNLIYAVVNGVSAVIYSTAWFALFAFYYGIMAIMRFLLVRYVSKNQIGRDRQKELRRARSCAYILMMVNLSLSGAVLMMVYHHRGFEYRGLLIYVMATYTFCITTTAIIDVIKYRKYNSPIMSVAKMIKFAAALMSMLSLETAMFSQFGTDMPAESQRLMIMLTGAGISLIVVAMAVYTIVGTTRELKKIRRQK